MAQARVAAPPEPPHAHLTALIICCCHLLSLGQRAGSGEHFQAARAAFCKHWVLFSWDLPVQSRAGVSAPQPPSLWDGEHNKPGCRFAKSPLSDLSCLGNSIDLGWEWCTRELLPARGGGFEQELTLIGLRLLFGKWSSAPALILGAHLKPCLI